jgi:hypothetical protein
VDRFPSWFSPGVEGRCYHFWTVGRDHQQRSGRPVRTPPALLPILKSRDAHANHRGKFRLRLAKLLSYRFDVLGRKFDHSAGLHFSSSNGTCLANTGDEALEMVFLHSRCSSSSSIASVKTGVSTNRMRSIVRQWRIAAMSFCRSTPDPRPITASS